MTFLKKLIKMKYWVVFLALALILLPQALNVQNEVTQRIFVTCAGVDAAAEEDGGGIELTVQLSMPEASETEPEIQHIASCKARGIAAALDGISARMGRTADMSFCNAVFIGREAAENGVPPYLDYFLRNDIISGQTYAVVAEGTAKDALNNLSKIDKAAAFTLGAYLKRARRDGAAAAVTVKEYAERNRSAGGAYLPVLDIRETGGGAGGDAPSGGSGESGGGGGQEGGPTAEIADARRTAIFENGRLRAILDADKTRALLRFDGAVKSGGEFFSGAEAGLTRGGSFGADVSADGIRLKLHSVKTGIKTAFRDGVPELTLNFKARAEIVEIEGQPFGFTPEEKRRLNAALSQSLSARIEEDARLIHAAVKECGADFLGIADRFYRYNHSAYGEYRAAHPDKFFPEGVNIVVKARADVI
jgi:hypothetical protein